MPSTRPADGINMIVFGPQKHGKSWLGDTAPGPRLVLDAEGGSRFTPSRKRVWDPSTEPVPEYDGTWDTVIVYVHAYRDVERAYEWLNSGQHPFRSTIIDSISEVQQRVIDDIAGRNQMSQPEWGTLLRTVSEMIRKFRDLSTHPTNPLDAVVLIAMSNLVDGVNRPYMQGAIKTTMPYYVDICSYLVMAPKDDGTVVRRLFVDPVAGFETGQRVGGCLGAFIDEPSVSGMVKSVRDYLASRDVENESKENGTT